MLSGNSISRSYLKYILKKTGLLTVITALLVAVTVVLLSMDWISVYSDPIRHYGFDESDIYVFFSIIILSLYSLIFSGITGNILFRKTTSDFAGSLPIKRAALQLTPAFAGVLSIFCISLTGMLALVFLRFDSCILAAGEVFRYFILLFAGSLLFFGFTSFSAAFAGNLLGYIVFSLFTVGLIPSLYSLINEYIIPMTVTTGFFAEKIQPLSIYAMSTYPFMAKDVIIISLINLTIAAGLIFAGVLVMKKREFEKAGSSFRNNIIPLLLIGFYLGSLLFCIREHGTLISAIIVTVFLLLIAFYLFSCLIKKRFLYTFLTLVCATAVTLSLYSFDVYLRPDICQNRIKGMNYDNIAEITLEIPSVDTVLLPVNKNNFSYLNIRPIYDGYLGSDEKHIFIDDYGNEISVSYPDDPIFNSTESVISSVAAAFYGIESDANTRTDIFSFISGKKLFDFGYITEKKVTITDSDEVCILRALLQDAVSPPYYISNDYTYGIPFSSFIVLDRPDSTLYYYTAFVADVTLSDGNKAKIKIPYGKFDNMYKEKFGVSLEEKYLADEKVSVSSPIACDLSSYHETVRYTDKEMLKELKAMAEKQRSELSVDERSSLRDSLGSEQGTYVISYTYKNGRYFSEAVKVPSDSSFYKMFVSGELKKLHAIINSSNGDYCIAYSDSCNSGASSKYDISEELIYIFREDIINSIEDVVSDGRYSENCIVSVLGNGNKAVFNIDLGKDVFPSIMKKRNKTTQTSADEIIFSSARLSIYQYDNAAEVSVFSGKKSPYKEDPLFTCTKADDAGLFSEIIKVFADKAAFSKEYFSNADKVLSGEYFFNEKYSRALVLKVYSDDDDPEYILFLGEMDYMNSIQKTLLKKYFPSSETIKAFLIMSSLITDSRGYSDVTAPALRKLYSFIEEPPITRPSDPKYFCRVTMTNDSGIGYDYICYVTQYFSDCVRKHEYYHLDD